MFTYDAKLTRSSPGKNLVMNALNLSFQLDYQVEITSTHLNK